MTSPPSRFPSGPSPEGTDRGEHHRPHREEEESGKDEEDQGEEHLDGSTSGTFLGHGLPLPSKVVRDGSKCSGDGRPQPLGAGERGEDAAEGRVGDVAHDLLHGGTPRDAEVDLTESSRQLLAQRAIERFGGTTESHGRGQAGLRGGEEELTQVEDLSCNLRLSSFRRARSDEVGAPKRHSRDRQRHQGGNGTSGANAKQKTRVHAGSATFRPSTASRGHRLPASSRRRARTSRDPPANRMRPSRRRASAHRRRPSRSPARGSRASATAGSMRPRSAMPANPAEHRPSKMASLPIMVRLPPVAKRGSTSTRGAPELTRSSPWRPRRRTGRRVPSA